MKVLGFVFALTLASTGSAQFGSPTMMFDMNYRVLAFVQRPEIRKELKLTKDQAKQIDQTVKEQSKMPPPTDFSKDVFAESDQQLLAILDDAQKQRLFEIRIQARGAVALADPEVAKLLSLSDEQSASVKKIRNDVASQFMGVMRKGGRGMKSEMEKMSKQEEKDLLALLSDAQKEGLTKLGGQPFKDARMRDTWPL